MKVDKSISVLNYIFYNYSDYLNEKDKKDFKKAIQTAECAYSLGYAEAKAKFEPKKAHFIKQNKKSQIGKCSECGTSYFLDDDKLNYCQFCGAKMDGTDLKGGD